jgi:hypothetical protein
MQGVFNLPAQSQGIGRLKTCPTQRSLQKIRLKTRLPQLRGWLSAMINHLLGDSSSQSWA